MTTVPQVSRREGVMRRTVRSGVLLTALALMGVTLGGCGPEPYQAADQQQSNTCDGISPPDTLSLIDPDAVITEVVVCGQPDERYVAGRGSFLFLTLHTLPRAKIPALMAGLTLPDATGTADGCDLSLLVLVDFTVTLADGSRIRPGLPGDGCHARRDALTAFGTLSSMPVRSEERGERVRTDLEVTSGCGSGAKSPAVWLDSVDTTGSSIPSVPSKGSVGVCRYHGDTWQEGTLVAAGLHGRSEVVADWPAPSDVATPTCTPPADAITTPPVDGVMIQRAPSRPYRLDEAGSGLFAMVELGGCRRMVSPSSGLVGSVDPATVDALAALADTAIG